MKILSFGGGLGNQIFCYAFYLYMKDKYPQERIYGLYNKKKLSEHHGLEIDKWFDVDLPPQKWYSTAFCAILYLWKKIVKKTQFVETNRDYCENENAIAFLAFKYTNLYYPNYEWLRFKIDEERLSPQNQEELKKIRSCNSVFVHVRRGDFLSPRYKEAFEGTCPLDYYEKAVMHVKQEVSKPCFFVFSDDLPWAKEHLPLAGCSVRYVDWNKGLESPIDMYLMSQCKYAIIANSTFSYWGAYLGRNKERVFYPTKWNNGLPTPNIFQNNWIAY